ncbi:ABC transporter [Gracilaria domingensis]|nr:ABC transporter [Gracilaria domingensis]
MPPKNKSKKFLAKQRAREEAEAAKKGPEAVEAVRRKYEKGGASTRPKAKKLDDVASSITTDSVKDELGDAAADTSTTATGILMSVYGARDIKIGAFSLNFHNKVLVEDTMIELTVGRRYGLIGRNGCGKSTFLKVLAERQVPIPEYIDIHLLSEEAHPSDDSALDYVINSARAEMTRLESKADDILTEEGPESLLLADVYEKLDELDPSTFESRASTILCGLGFTSQTIQKKTKDMSGGWRMRVALAKALFIQPTMLLLDEPTNHVSLKPLAIDSRLHSESNDFFTVISNSSFF